MAKFDLIYEERIELEIKYVCKCDFSIRKIADLMYLSKTTVHLDLTERLKEYSYSDYLKVREVFNEHIKTWHIKGGEATKKKYKMLREKRK